MTSNLFIALVANQNQIRNMKKIEITKNKDLILIDLNANAFLLHGKSIGTLIMVGKR